jgi:hypothetical protein
VDDAFLMRGFEGFGNLLRYRESFFNWNRTFSLDAQLQRVAGNQLHDEGIRAVGMFKAVDRGDVRMIQLRQHFRLALKTGEPFGIVHERFRQNFDGYFASELGVVRLIHSAHATRADLREDFVRAEFCAGSDYHYFFSTGECRFRSSNPIRVTCRRGLRPAAS